MNLGVINIMLFDYYLNKLEPIYQQIIQLFNFFSIIFIIVLITYVLILIQLKFTPINYNNMFCIPTNYNNIICICVPLLFIPVILYFIGFIDNKFIKSYLVKWNTNLSVVKDNSMKLFIDNMKIAIDYEISFGHILLFFGYFCFMVSTIFIPLSIILLFFIFFTYLNTYFFTYEIKYNEYKLDKVSQPVFKNFDEFYYACKSSSNIEESISLDEYGNLKDIAKSLKSIRVILKHQMNIENKIISKKRLIYKLKIDNLSRSVELIDELQMIILDLRQRYSILDEHRRAFYKLQQNQTKILRESTNRMDIYLKYRDPLIAHITGLVIGFVILMAYYNLIL